MVVNKRKEVSEMPRCTQCGGEVVRGLKVCPWCGTEFYVGPEVPKDKLVPLYNGQPVTESSYLTHVRDEGWVVWNR